VARLAAAGERPERLVHGDDPEEERPDEELAEMLAVGEGVEDDDDPEEEHDEPPGPCE
jgi:hypothetical protein